MASEKPRTRRPGPGRPPKDRKVASVEVKGLQSDVPDKFLATHEDNPYDFIVVLPCIDGAIKAVSGAFSSKALTVHAVNFVVDATGLNIYAENNMPTGVMSGCRIFVPAADCVELWLADPDAQYSVYMSHQEFTKSFLPPVQNATGQHYSVSHSNGGTRLKLNITARAGADHVEMIKLEEPSDVARTDVINATSFFDTSDASIAHLDANVRGSLFSCISTGARGTLRSTVEMGTTQLVCSTKQDDELLKWTSVQVESNVPSDTSVSIDCSTARLLAYLGCIKDSVSLAIKNDEYIIGQTNLNQTVTSTTDRLLTVQFQFFIRHDPPHKNIRM